MLTPHNLIAHSAALNILCTLERTDVFVELKKNTQGISATDIAEKLSLDETVLESLLDFLVINSKEILQKKDKMYLLGEAFDTSAMQNNLLFSLAYQPVFENLTGLLRKEVIYGKDVLRRGAYLRESSHIYNNKAWDFIIDYLRKEEVNTVVDLGCSAGDFLVQVHDNFPRMQGIGIEIDKEVVVLANDLLTEKGLNNNIFINEGDVMHPEEWQDSIKKYIEPQHTVFTGITVWHEFLDKGEKNILDILSKYRLHFPGCTLIIVEYNGIPFEEFDSLPESFRESASVYQLVHPLTLQGLPQPPKVWQTILTESGIRIQETVQVEPNSTAYIGIL